MHRAAYRVVDVFTDRPLTGNALCVITDPVDDELMGPIAREMNLSETTFVTRQQRTGARGGTYDVRIWTPGGELPFAGHPTLGTAFVLGPGHWTQRSAGATVEVEASTSGAVMIQPDPVFTEVYPEGGASALGLEASAVPKAWVAEVGGMRHLLLPMVALDALRPNMAALSAAARDVGAVGVCPMARVDDTTLHIRVFLPATSIPEDPATGSAAGPVGILARRLWGTAEDVTIRQGDEMGRPSRMEVHAATGEVRVGGAVTDVAEGRLTL